MDGGDDGYRKFRGEADESNDVAACESAKQAVKYVVHLSAGECGFRQPAFVEAIPFSWRVQNSEFTQVRVQRSDFQLA